MLIYIVFLIFLLMAANCTIVISTSRNSKKSYTNGEPFHL